MIAKSRGRKKRDNKETIAFQSIFFAVILFLMGSLLVSNFKLYRERRELTERSESLKKDVGLLEEEQEMLAAGISQTERESYWEEKAREQGYVKEGEESVVVIPPQGMTKEEAEEKEQGAILGLIEKIKSWLAQLVGE
jgi:cell division protein FtsB